RATLKLNAVYFSITLNNNGHISSLFDKSNNREYMVPGQEGSLLGIRNNGICEYPSTIQKKGNALTLVFKKNNVKGQVSVTEKTYYLAFELLKVNNNEAVGLIIWGPFPTIIQRTIGESVGV